MFVQTGDTRRIAEQAFGKWSQPLSPNEAARWRATTTQVPGEDRRRDTGVLRVLYLCKAAEITRVDVVAEKIR